MKGLIIYSSRSGGTKRLAKGLQRELQIGTWDLCDIKEEPDISSYDIVMLGFWVYRGTWDPLTQNFIETFQNKDLFIFGTLGVYEDKPYSHRVIEQCVEDLRKRGNRVHGSFLCMGALDPKRLEEKIKNPEKFRHPVTEEKLIRSQVFANYPTEKEIAVCGERFTNRLLVLKRRGEFK